MKKAAAWHQLIGKAARVLKDDGIIRLFIVLKHYLFGMGGPEGGLSNIMTPSPAALKKWRKSSRSFQYRPKISIILPIGSGNPRRLGATVDSVLNQAYDHWELCIAVGGAAQAHTAERLDSYRKQDARIKVQSLSSLSASDLSNAAIALATGEFCGFLNPDDALTLSALYEVVHFLNKTQATDFIYSDEVLLDESGEPAHTLYRTDFSMDYLLSHCYIGHFSLIRTDLLNKIGGFRSEIDAARDHDLFLRMGSETQKVGHIPKILYLRRQQDSDAGQAPIPAVVQAGQKAIEDFLEREGIDAEVYAAERALFFRVQRRIVGNPKISIIIPTRDRVNLLKQCISSIEEKTRYNQYEVIIVDNASRQADTLEYLANLQSRSGRFRVVSFLEEFNFSRLNNFAVPYAVGDHLLFLNNDIEIITPGWLEAMIEQSQRPEVGCVGAKLLYPDGKIQHVGVVIGLYGGADHIYKGHDSDDTGYMGQFASIRSCSAVTAACLMVKRNIFDQVGGFDETYRVGFGDTDFCLRVQEKGYTNLFTPYATLYHHESATRGQSVESDPHLEDTRRFMSGWQKIIREGDPFYNPNLPLHRQPQQGERVFL